MAASFCCPSLAAQDARELIERNLQAKGGLEKLRSTTSRRFSGSIFLSSGQQGELEILQSRPRRIRLGLTLGGASSLRGYDGQDAWRFEPVLLGGSGAPERLPEREARDFIESADFDGPLVDFLLKGHRIELVGRGALDGADAFKLKITRASGLTEHLYLDARTFLERKAIYSRFDERLGREIETEQIFSDYREVEGLTFAHSIETRVQGQVAYRMVFTRIELNPTIEEKEFQRPAHPR